MWEMSGLLLRGVICLTGNFCNTEPDQRLRAGENGKGKDDGRQEWKESGSGPGKRQRET